MVLISKFRTNIRALTYILSIGGDRLKEASKNAVLNANYMMEKLNDLYTVAYLAHAFMSLCFRWKKKNTSTMFPRKMHQKSCLIWASTRRRCTSPNIVHEALMIEPNETGSKETLDFAFQTFRDIYHTAMTNGQALSDAPLTTPVKRVDDVLAARSPILIY